MAISFCLPYVSFNRKHTRDKGTLVESTSQRLLTYNMKHLILLSSSFSMFFSRKYFNVKIENNSNFWYECDLKLYWSCLHVAVVVAFYVVQEKETKAKKKYFHIVALPIETISHYMLLFSMLVNFFSSLCFIWWSIARRYWHCISWIGKNNIRKKREHRFIGTVVKQIASN